MALPAAIEIVPPPAAAQAIVTVPGSKSITNRALVLAALGLGETVLSGALWSEDTQVMVECLQELGYMVNVEPDHREACNRTITIYGRGAQLPRGGTESEPLELFVGNAGTTARFLSAMVCLGSGYYLLKGAPRMHERPQSHLFQALRQLGYTIETPNDRLPALIQGGGPRPGQCGVSIEESSQFASALLLAASAGQWQVTVEGENDEESPYVAMTSRLIEVFPSQGGEFRIEPDASSGSYFWALNLTMGASSCATAPEPAFAPIPVASPIISVAHWPCSGWQVDERFPNYVAMLKTLRPRPHGIGGSGEPALPGGTPEGWRRAQEFASASTSINHQPSTINHTNESPRIVISRRTDLGDSIMTAIVVAATLSEPVRFTDLGRLRVQECERVVALRNELARCGARIIESGDTLTVYPSELHGAEIQTYEDHRMAMCFAVLGTRVSGIWICNPSCVRKTFPNFFQKLAAAPPHGPGVMIRDAATGRVLSNAELFAE